jgi:putative Holliday junction resolvase
MSQEPHDVPGRIMALDVGDARVGVAVSDPLQLIAQPLCTVDRQNGGVEKLVRLIVEHEVKRLVIGLPLELDGAHGPQAKKVEAFAAKLKKALRKQASPSPPEVVFWDERFTSGLAERFLAGSKLKNRDCHAALDRVSAAVILESYIDSL